MSCCEHTLNTLRYADRVKELGPGGPSEPSKAREIEPPPPANIGGALSPQNSDLLMLRTANVSGWLSYLIADGELIKDSVFYRWKRYLKNC